MIKANAVKCRYCKEIFDPRLKKTAKKKSRGGDYDDDLSTGDWIVAILCPVIGCIAGVVWMIQGKSKGLKTIGVSFLAWIIWTAIRTAAKMAVEN